MYVRYTEYRMQLNALYISVNTLHNKKGRRLLDNARLTAAAHANTNDDDFMFHHNLHSPSNTLCFAPNVWDIGECLFACPTVYETEWDVQFLQWSYDNVTQLTQYVYSASTSLTVGECQQESGPKRMTAFYLIFNGCCKDIAVDDRTYSIEKSEVRNMRDGAFATDSVFDESESGTSDVAVFLKGGWMFHSDLKPGDVQLFRITLSGYISPTLGSVCVRGDNIRCSCGYEMQMPDFCNAQTSDTSGVFREVDHHHH